MTTYKTAELAGPLLDEVVAKTEGIAVVLRPERLSEESEIVQQPATEHEFDPEGPANEFSVTEWKMWRHYRPCADWMIGGPIIDRERIGLIPQEDGSTWLAKVADSDWIVGGTTALEAAMRAYVIAKLGEEVELP